MPVCSGCLPYKPGVWEMTTSVIHGSGDNPLDPTTLIPTGAGFWPAHGRVRKHPSEPTNKLAPHPSESSSVLLARSPGVARTVASALSLRSTWLS